ncbi:LemA family protein [Treponema pedis]|uniref:LemA n=2 Tax=Treponema pedis TaxID=409322 RepID=S5ZQM4_9SPIR|nr:LemA family protein [Treponema pedis]AGT44967.1 LemA [Treponema pedis str. T A4]QOW60244.1 LemA family protein [Treponema pedis]QSI05586.1 LemA family protein [Treponema pedis]
MGKTLKVGLIVVGVIAALIFFAYSFFGGSYNSMVTAEESVKSAWSQVENVYQRRLDLIPNLVNTVKGFASHEAKVFTDLAEARSKAGGVMQVSDEVLNNAESFEKFQKAQSELGGALQRLLAITENYPELKSNENFLDLQSQLEGTENRIAVERKRYNETVQSYNVLIKRFPKNILANMYGFKEKQYFKADEQASKAPEVKF